MKRYLAGDELKLYTLIWQRFVASQMTPALFDVTDVLVEAGRYGFKARGEVEVEAGYLRVYREEDAPPDKPPQEQEEEEATSKRLPVLSEGEVLTLEELTSIQKFTQPPPRFTESTLVKALEENGIGRPRPMPRSSPRSPTARTWNARKGRSSPLSSGSWSTGF
jgi:DNA topoisomerase-1